jgi:hypothetical protein
MRDYCCFQASLPVKIAGNKTEQRICDDNVSDDRVAFPFFYERFVGRRLLKIEGATTRRAGRLQCRAIGTRVPKAHREGREHADRYVQFCVSIATSVIPASTSREAAAEFSKPRVSERSERNPGITFHLKSSAGFSRRKKR